MADPIARCPGCGASVERDATVAAPGGPAASECYDRFTTLLAASYQDPSRRPVHQLLVDAYTAQHGGGTSRRECLAVAVCLMTLLLFLERGEDPARGPALHRRMAESVVRFVRLPRPEFDGGSTVLAVAEASDADYRAVLRRWADDVWRAWEPQRPVVLGWLRETVGR